MSDPGFQSPAPKRGRGRPRKDDRAGRLYLINEDEEKFQIWFGRRLRKIRQILGVSAREVARAIGHDSYDIVKRSERGERRTSVYEFLQLCLVFDVSPLEFLLIGEDWPKDLPRQSKRGRRNAKTCGNDTGSDTAPDGGPGGQPGSGGG